MGLLSYAKSDNHKLSTITWKKFPLTDLFNIQLAKGDIQAKKMEKGNIPLVSAGMVNNGIVMYIKNGDGISEIFPSKCITFDMFGNSFYKDKEFNAVSHGRVNILLPIFQFNRNIDLFIISIFDKIFDGKYSFSVMCSQSKLAKETIYLPVDENSNPDWQYIEEIQKNILKNTNQHINNLINIVKNSENTKIDISHWKKFKLTDLFNIQTGANILKEKLEDGNIPRISVTNTNNGIQGYYTYVDNKNYRLNENFISFSFLGTCFYHPYKASLDMKVHSLKPKNYILTKYSGIFLVSVLKKMFQTTVSYTDQISSSDLKRLSVYLPADNNGNPDWQYMEDYIKNLYEKIEKVIL